MRLDTPFDGLLLILYSETEPLNFLWDFILNSSKFMKRA
jgi:hypothetical protein